jgi:uncharacterized cofD-like protein
MSLNKKTVTIIGGGTGTSVVLSGLKKHPLHLNAVISVADSGGSTGRLRDEFGFLPVGDLRQAIAALSADDNDGYISKLLLYRFTKGSGLDGHNLGNLMLTALQDMTGSTAEALQIASAIFRLNGRVCPVTLKDIQLVIEYADGTVEIGESVLDNKHGGKKISSVKTSPQASISPQAKQAIQSADCIVIGPGDIYGSLLPNFVIDGMSSVIAATATPIIYVVNLMTHYTQTHQMTAKDHLEAIEQYLPRPVDYILINNQIIPKAIITQYQKQHEYPVVDNLAKDSRVIRKKLIKTLNQNYLRHNPTKVADAIMGIINGETKGDV